MKDYYGVLGVGSNADEKAIKSAYRRLAKRTHPDLAPVGRKAAATEQFKVVAEAYWVLSDKFRRCEYDLSRKGVEAGLNYKVQGSRKAQGESSKVKGRTRDVSVEELFEEILRYANEEFYKADKATYAVRFGCGGILGLLAGLVIWMGFFVESGLFAFCILAGIGVFGFLSAYYGDRFWDRLMELGDANLRRRWR